MKRIESIEDDMNCVVTYELSDGRRVRLDARYVSELGAAECLRRMGMEAPKGRVPVMHHGQMVGTVPADFDPMFIKSRSFMYEPRPGDFRKEGARWIASNMLGPGDIAAIAGFVHS